MSPYCTPISLFTLLSLVPLALAHIQLVDPYPILSPMNPAVPWDEKNYNMMAPLTWEGDDLPYPCKGYLSSTSEEDRISQKTWPAGSTQTLSFGTGGAPHLGGSCQVVLSYDNGATWQVIYSYIGGCMIESWSWSFPIPSEAPSGEAILGWNWFNNQGNREMYQNCAVVTITQGGEGLPEGDDYPPPFVANAKVNQCSTVEGQDPVFPRPGKNVHWSGKYKDGWRPENGYGTTGSGCEDEAGGAPAGANGLGQGQEAGPAASSVQASSIPAETSSATTPPTDTPSETATATESSSTTPDASTEAAHPTSTLHSSTESSSSSSAPSASPTASVPGNGNGHIAFPPPSDTASTNEADYTPPAPLPSPSPSPSIDLSISEQESAAEHATTDSAPSGTVPATITDHSTITSHSVQPTSTIAKNASVESVSPTTFPSTASTSSEIHWSSSTTVTSSISSALSATALPRPTSCAVAAQRRRLRAGFVKVKREKLVFSG